MRCAALALAASLSACSYHITTSPSVLSSPRPGPELAIGVEESAVKVVDVAGARNEEGRPRPDLAAAVRGALVSESGGAVRAAGQQALRLFTEVRFEGDRPDANIVIGVFSFFIPPLAFVPEAVSARYAVAYALRDRAGRTVYEQKLEGSVEGSFKGWYIARINACQNLFKEEQLFAAKDAARAVLNDLFAHASEIAAALRGSSSPPPQAEPAAESRPAAAAVPAPAPAAEPPVPAPQPKPRIVISDEDLLP